MNENIFFEPVVCRTEAYHLFRDSLETLDTTDGLLTAATAVALHALDDADPARVRQKLVSLADEVRSRVRGDDPNAILAHLHDVLFIEEGFTGNSERYYLALNSYVPAVLASREGLPIILSLIYKFVAEHVGVEVEGVNAPGHFMVRVKTPEGWMIVDPFSGGRMLSREEAFQRIERIAGQKFPRGDVYLPSATHAQWLARILNNLLAIFTAESRRDDLIAMTELQTALARHVSDLQDNHE
jgi:regulator of sirC expression with transglutaminase-like and TPR domain